MTVVRRHVDKDLQCSGQAPCYACATRDTSCVFDVESDQRRKIAQRRNASDLARVQADLENHRQLLGGILALLRTSRQEESDELLALVRSEAALSQTAAFVRRYVQGNHAAKSEFTSIDFTIDHLERSSSLVQLPRIREQGLVSEHLHTSHAALLS